MIHDMDVNYTIKELPIPKKIDLLKLNEVQEVQKSYLKNKEISELNNAGALFGSHLSMNFMIEREQASRIGRLFNERSSNIALENLTNRLDTIEFSDYLGHDNPHSENIDYDRLFE